MEVSRETIQKNMMWNVAGSVAFSAAQWLMTILIVHLAGYTEAGNLSLGLSLTNIFTNIAYFCIRNFQVSDAKEKYSADVYVTHRIITATAAMGICAIFVLVNGYSPYVTSFLLLFMLYRVSEPVADVFHGIDQKAWRLDIAGKSFVARGLFMLAVFVCLEAVTKNLVITTMGMSMAVFAVVFFYDIPRAREIEHFCVRFDGTAMRRLTRECFPLFVYAICLNAVVPIPRYFLEKLAGSEVLGFYSSVAIPASIIQLLASYVFGTFTKLFTGYYAEGQKDRFMMLFWRIAAAVGGIVALALAGSALLGEWVLCLLFTDEIKGYAYLLAPTVFCCGLIAFIWFMGALLTVLRDISGLFAGAVVGTAVCAVISYPCIAHWGVDGVNVSLFASSAVTLVLFVWRFAGHMRRWKP